MCRWVSTVPPGVPSSSAIFAFRPRLTAIAQPIYEIGHRAVSLLLRRIENPDRPTSTVRIPAQFMHRESCGCVQPGVRTPEQAPSGSVAE